MKNCIICKTEQDKTEFYPFVNICIDCAEILFDKGYSEPDLDKINRREIVIDENMQRMQ